MGDFSGVVPTNADGLYAVCGVPGGTRIAMHALAEDGLSNFVSLAFVRNGVLVGQEFHEMTNQVWLQDFEIARTDERSTELVGTVTDAIDGSRVVGAEVFVVGTPLITETDGTGFFRLPRLPSGPAMLRIRRVGARPFEYHVDLPASGVLTVPDGEISLNPAPTELDPVVVEVAPPQNPLAEFEARREQGLGNFITRQEFEQQGHPIKATDILRRMHGVQVIRGRDFDKQWVVSMRRGGPRSFGYAGDMGCPPLYFLDRHFLGNADDVDVDAAIPLEDVEAIEAYNAVATLPSDFNRVGARCGVIAFWTRYADPNTIPVDEEPSRGVLRSPIFHMAVTLGALTLVFLAIGVGIHF
jgi:hypothetical protein